MYWLLLFNIRRSFTYFFSFVFSFFLSCELIPSWAFTLSFLLLYFYNNFIAVRFSNSSAAHLAPVFKGEKNSIFDAIFVLLIFSFVSSPRFLINPKVDDA